MDKVFLKGLALLELLVVAEQSRGVTELANETGLAKSNVHRLLQTLLHSGYVSKDALSGRYACTPKIWQMGMTVGRRIDIRPIARPFLLELAGISQETVHLSIREGSDVIYIDKIDSSHPIGTYTKIGGRAPLYCTSTGKALLSSLPDEELPYIVKNMQRFTAKTVTDLAELRTEVAKIRRDGVAVNRGEWNTTVGGVAAPVFDASGTACAAIGMSGPLDRLTPKVLKDMTPLVVKCAQQISLALGGLIPGQPADLLTAAASSPLKLLDQQKAARARQNS